MAQVRAVAHRHPLIGDGVLAASAAGLAAPATETSGWGWAAYLLLHVPLVWRRRAPQWVLGGVAAMVPVALLADVQGPSLVVVPAIAVYTVGRYRPRRDLWPAAAMTVVFVVMWVLGSGLWWDAAALAGIVAAAALLGSNIATRRAYLAELEERARQVERERDQRAQLAVAAERSRIARDVHDIVAHNLAVMVALADGAAASARSSPDQAADLMGKISTTGRQALGEIRRLLGVLREPDAAATIPAETTTEPRPGLDEINGLIEQVRSAGLAVTLTTHGVPGEIGQGAELAVYRIAQEALTNTMKHSGPGAAAEVRLTFAPDGVEVEVVDDGGSDAAPANGGPRWPAVTPGDSARAADDQDGSAGSAGHGLAGMSERVAPYHGHVTAGPRPGRGWRVHARLRLDESTGV